MRLYNDASWLPEGHETTRGDEIRSPANAEQAGKFGRFTRSLGIDGPLVAPRTVIDDDPSLLNTDLFLQVGDHVVHITGLVDQFGGKGLGRRVDASVGQELELLTAQGIVRPGYDHIEKPLIQLVDDHLDKALLLGGGCPEGGEYVLLVPRLDGLFPYPNFFQEHLHVEFKEEHADAPGDGGRMGNDLDGGGGDGVSSRRADAHDTGVHRHLFPLLERLDVVADDVAGGDCPSRRVDPDDHRGEVIVLLRLFECLPGQVDHRGTTPHQ